MDWQINKLKLAVISQYNAQMHNTAGLKVVGVFMKMIKCSRMALTPGMSNTIETE